MIDIEAMPHIADIPRVQAERMPDRAAMWFEDQVTTYRELQNRSSRVANGLIGLGIKPGDRVCYLGKNTAVYYEMMFGAAKARAAMAAINYRLAPPEVQFVLTDTGASVLFVASEYYELVEKVAADCPELKTIVAIDGGHDSWPDYKGWRSAQSLSDPELETLGDDDVIQLYTSGTTGRPKGVCLTNANYKSFMSQAGILEWSLYDEGDPVMNAMPLFHVAGVNVGVMGMAQGTEVVILREINPVEILRLIEDKKIAHAFWVPAVILLLTQQPNIGDVDFSSLKMVAYGASPIAEELLVRAQEIMECKFCQLYGLTETVGGGTYLPPEAHDPSWGKLRSCGVPYPGTIVRCMDENGQPVPTGEVGEIAIQSGFVMKGYWNRPDATEEAIRGGFFHTGDAGYFDEDGFLFIYDRVKDMIVSGGENVYPAEVENAIFSHPGVADVAVIGIPDEKWGEAVKAIIVKAPEADPSDDEIIAWCRERIAGYKCPKSVDRIEALPRNPSGKILRKDLRAPYWKDHVRNVG